MPHIKPLISIIIPLFNEEKFIGDCLQSLLSIDYAKEKFEIIVVDNGSEDGSAEIVKQLDVKLYSRPKVKVGAVRNYGVSISNGKYLAFLDADCTVEPDWLNKGVKELSTYDAVGGLVKLRNNPTWIEKYWLLNDSTPSVYQKTFSGACIFINRSVFDDIGGFDESLNAGEDSALTDTLNQSGFKIKIMTKLNVTHLGFPTTILEFIDRQKWHSSDYIYNLRNFFTDKVFFLVVMYMFAAVFMLYGALLDLNIFLVSVIIFLIIPGIFSTKRIIRYGGLKKGYSILLIYAVDTLYLIGRSYGFVTGGIHDIFERKNAESKISKKSATD